LKWGDGRIVLVNARLLERLHIPACASELESVLSLGGREKPLVLINAGPEWAQNSSSVVTDFMNAHDIPFETLGEVVALAQGIGADKPISGRRPYRELPTVP